MFEGLTELEQRYEELSRLMADPNICTVPAEYSKLAKEHAKIVPIIESYREYKDVVQNLEENTALLDDDIDEEFRELVESEIDVLNQKRDSLEHDIKMMLLPKDPNDEKNVIMEIRAGTGGNEAALFAGDLFRMYTRYAERKGWKTEIMSSSPTDLGGFKEIIFVIEGEGVYSKLKYESGVHRVQRIPVTESGGRIHTSTTTVAVLPEAEDVEVNIDPKDLRIDTYCSSGPGGQSVNTTYSAIRITHIPTGLVVTCQDEKSQIKNRERAMRVLRARLFDTAKRSQQEEMAEARRAQVGMAERSERIRTYNFPQSRITDHRVGLTMHNLAGFLDGDIDEMVETLVIHDQTQTLAGE